jgi:predicted naringenin-chalcone synthase
MTEFEILGLGTALPEHSISQKAMATFAATCIVPEMTGSKNPEGLIEIMYRRAGVQSRHSVLLESSSDDEATAERFFRNVKDSDDHGPGTAERMQRFERESPGLALRASLSAIQESAVAPEEITHLITVSCSGFCAPGFDISLIRDLGLRQSVARTHVGFMGCHAALNALRVAHAFASADPTAMILVCAVELCTLHHQYGWDPQRIVANSLFADGAAAIVGRSSGKSEGRTQDVEEASSPARREMPGHLIDSASFVIPDTDEMMTWRVGNNGFEMSLSPEVPGVITRMLPQVLGQFLSRHGLEMDDIQSWAIHPGGPRILAATAEAAGLTEAQMSPSLDVFQTCGNMSSPTVLFILDNLRKRNSQLPCVMLGFGPGLNVETALLM